MPVTKTAKRALRSSKRKEGVNKVIKSQLEIALRVAKKTKSPKDTIVAISLTDRAAKKKVIHKNKAAHIKSSLSRLAKPQSKAKKSPKKTSR